MYILNICRNLTQIKQSSSIIRIALNKKFSTKSVLQQQKLPYEYTKSRKSKTTSTVILYTASALIFMLGCTYAAVPLYKMFCEAQGIDIKTSRDESDEVLKKKMSALKRNKDRIIKVKFLANKSTDLLWNFEPIQTDINLAIGETALAFYKAKNLTDRPIIGIATYNILPFEAGLYFNKIQCFCFEEQRLEPGEEVDMPVFFYLDDQFGNDPLLEKINSICLSYTFFESKGSIELEKELPNLPKKFLK